MSRPLGRVLPSILSRHADGLRLADQRLKLGEDGTGVIDRDTGSKRLPSLTLDQSAAAMDHERRWRYLYPGQPVPCCTAFGGLRGLHGFFLA
jgi:hypothetical protein